MLLVQTKEVFSTNFKERRYPVKISKESWLDVQRKNSLELISNRFLINQFHGNNFELMEMKTKLEIWINLYMINHQKKEESLVFEGPY